MSLVNQRNRWENELTYPKNKRKRTELFLVDTNFYAEKSEQ